MKPENGSKEICSCQLPGVYLVGVVQPFHHVVILLLADLLVYSSSFNCSMQPVEVGDRLWFSGSDFNRNK